MDTGDITRVAWKDSRSWSGWNDREDLLRWANDADAIVIVSVGFLLEDNDKHILIIQSMHGSEGGAGNALLIPKEAVISIHTLANKPPDDDLRVAGFD